jgi:hypothetical protein
VKWVFVTPDFRIGIEDVDGMIFCHATVLCWSARVAREVSAAAGRLLGDYGPPLWGFAMLPHGGDHMKFDRFMTWLGFFYHSVIVVRGFVRVLYVRWS